MLWYNTVKEVIIVTINERIKARRKELNLSVDDIAKKIGKDRATVYRYESSRIENMPVSILEPLAEALNCSPAYLMGWDESAKTSSYNLPEIIPPSKVDPDMFVLNMYKRLDIEDKAEVRGTMKQMLKADKYNTEFATEIFEDINADIKRMIKKGNVNIK